jgi:hypothetical protein
MTVMREDVEATWNRLNRLGDAAEDRRIGHRPPATVLAAADALLAGADVRYVDAAITVTDRTEWRLIVFTDEALIDVSASADDGLWVYNHPGPSSEYRLKPRVSARSWPLDRVRALVLDTSPSEWLPGESGVPAPPIRIEIDGADDDVPVPLNPTRRAECIEAVQTVVGLVRAARFGRRTA